MVSGSAKRLIVNADDLGFTRDVNDGIVEAHRNGILTSATLMAGGAAFEHGVECALDNPRLDIGVHLTLVGERSLSRPGEFLPSSLQALVAAVFLRQLAVEDEMDAQMSHVLRAGIRPTHLDTHKHTHLLPRVAQALGKISRNYRIPWVRRPLAKPFLGKISERVLRRYGCKMADHFLGFDLTGKFGERELVKVIEGLEEGTSEFMCHPGFCGPELRQAATRLKESRELELRALISPRAREAIEKAGIELCGYGTLERLQ